MIMGVCLAAGVCGNPTARGNEKKPEVVLFPMPRSVELENKDDATDSGPKQEIRNEAAMPDQNTGDRDLVLNESTQPSSDIQVETEHSYEAKSQLDPFIPLIQEKKPAAAPEVRKTNKPRRMLTPLEKMTLSQLKLVAVVIGENKKIAMVEEATGKGYEVRIGTYMGKNQGQVVDIQSDHIVVKELVTDFKGVVTERLQELKLQKPDIGE